MRIKGLEWQVKHEWLTYISILSFRHAQRAGLVAIDGAGQGRIFGTRGACALRLLENTVPVSTAGGHTHRSTPHFLTPPPRSVEARHPLESHYSGASTCAVCICARGGGRVASDRRRQLRPLPDAEESGAGVGALVPLGHSAPLPASGNACRDLPLTSIESLSVIRFRLAAHLFL